MPVVSVSFSISPGCVPPVKTAVLQAVRDPNAPPCLLTMHLAEIGEVNTLCAFFASEDIVENLTHIDRWLDTIRDGPVSPHLRHIERNLHHSDAQIDQWRALEHAARVALVQRVFDQRPPSIEPGSVVLHPLTGRHGKTWVFTPAANHDAALALCLSSTLDPITPLRDSVMWIPVL
ncbi:MAG: hypothetical protein IPL15_01030 [Comamonadaceae bacterium]|jgi:hypothetical protein|uniref:hypothetical protein n=1 Tax=Candidatus Skiveiella danica TaxID=3386177 RepID=UPI001DCE5D01|nr:hypothetical protein [Comamonadaceae bacterium]MBK9200264.1 hypothetical protein [Betaproteobacteria bacterium]MBK6556949.1 hypothetical protein [Comamonadaceae bacterium]MBK6926494.1 hypothetical protein [Comamonadaceae bacterium]MBK7118367.1 hypothetical protein [Comamonadaceae bacterium]